MSLLGYIPAHNRVYVMDKDINVSGYLLSLSVIEYQTAILRGDMVAAEQILPTVPKDQRNKVARFLENRGVPHSACTRRQLIPHRSKGAGFPGH